MAEIRAELDVPASMRDGTVLRANLYRPAGEGRWPVLLTRLPYGKDLALGSSVLDPVQAARRGYLVVVQDTRGRFQSEGDWEPFVHEANDGADTVAWAGSLAHSDGQVGMYGASYFGFTQWAAASQQPEALRALVPMITWADPFDGLMFRGGALELGVAASWNLQMGINLLMRRHATDPAALDRELVALVQELDNLGARGYAELPLSDFPPLRRAGLSAPFLGATPPGPISPALNVAEIRSQARVPTLNIGGWYDLFLAGTIDNHLAMRRQGVPSKLVIGPWTHSTQANPVGEINFGFGAQAALMDLKIDLMNLQLRWFDHWLKGRDTGMLQEPPIRLFVMGANRWRDEWDWPPRAAREIRFHLRAEGGLSRQAPEQDEEPDRFVYEPQDPVPTRGGATLMSPEYRAGPYDQGPIEARSDVLVYTTEPLLSDLEVTGRIQVHLWAASTASDTDFVSRLCDVHPDGRSINLTDGILRTGQGAGSQGGHPSSIEAGSVNEYVIDLWATSNLFKAGHRIRVHITSSSFPRWDRNPNIGRQTIFHDRQRPGHIVLEALEA